MARASRLIDAFIGLIEASVERVGDPDRVKYLERALRESDRRLAEFAAENASLEERLERLESTIQDIGCALGVEDEPLPDIVTAAWSAAGEIEGARVLREEIDRLKSAEVRRRPVPSGTPSPQCTCDRSFRTAEDWRDHMPCGGRDG